MLENGTLIARGRTGEIFAHGDGRIFKLYLPGVSLKAVEHEFGVSELAYQRGVPTPQPIARLDIDGRYGIVYGRIEGKTMLHTMASEPQLVEPMARTLAELQYGVHQITVAGLPSRLTMLKRDIGQVRSLTEEQKAAVISHLDTLVEGEFLCHGDFHPDNVMIAGARAFVIDWMTGASGSPASEVARTCVILSTATPPPGAPPIVAAVLDQLRTAFYPEYLTHYVELSCMSMAEIEDWVLPVAAARLSEGLPEVEQQQLLAMIEAKLGGKMVLVAP